MISPESRYKPNSTEVAAKVIDGEAIIMNLSNGLYFSMDRVGATIWEMVEREFSVREMADELARLYEADRARASTDVTDLVGQLVQENLVLESEGSGNGARLDDDGGARGRYEPPVLNTYDDMADLLALDPPMPTLGGTDFSD